MIKFYHSTNIVILFIKIMLKPKTNIVVHILAYWDLAKRGTYIIIIKRQIGCTDSKLVGIQYTLCVY